MKKNVLRALSVLLVLVMVVSLTACGGGKFATVKAFLDDPDTKAELDKSISAMLTDDSISVTLEGTEDTLIYNFKFSDDALASTDEETLKASLASAWRARSSPPPSRTSPVPSLRWSRPTA